MTVGAEEWRIQSYLCLMSFDYVIYNLTTVGRDFSLLASARLAIVSEKGARAIAVKRRVQEEGT